MFCPKCGTLNNAQGGRCTSCGYDFGLIPDHIKERNTTNNKTENAQDTPAAFGTETADNAFGTESAAENTANAEATSEGCGAFVQNTADDTAAKSEEVKKPIQTYMIRAILLTIFGSVAFGIVSIIFSGMTQTELAAGSADKAREYSEKTRMFCWISLFIGIAKYICIALFFLLYLVF